MKKKLMDISVKVKTDSCSRIKTDMLVLGLFKDSLKQSTTAAEIDKKIGGDISKLIRLGDFKGEKLTTALIAVGEGIRAKRILLIGLGPKKEYNPTVVRETVSLACRIAVEKKCTNAAIGLCLDLASREIDLSYQNAAEAALFGAYRYDEFIKSPEDNQQKKYLSRS